MPPWWRVCGPPVDWMQRTEDLLQDSYKNEAMTDDTVEERTSERRIDDPVNRPGMGTMRRWFQRRQRRKQVKAISERLLQFCVGRDDSLILEIGCHYGTDTRRFLSLFPQATIYCFEPEPRAIAGFRRTVGDDPRVSLFEVALSDRAGTVRFYQSGGTPTDGGRVELSDGCDLSGSIKVPKRHKELYDWITFENTIEVATCTLDGWADQHNVRDVDFIWMDVQGAELDVIQGAQKTLATTRFLYTECIDVELYEGQPSLEDLLKALPGFELVVRYPDDVLLRNRSYPFEPDAALRKAIKHRRC